MQANRCLSFGIHSALLVMLWSVPQLVDAGAPDWVRVSASPDYSDVISLDRNSVRYRDGRLSAWTRSNRVLSQQTTDSPPKEYLSVLYLQRFDCGSQSSGLAQVHYYSGHNGEGEVVSSQEVSLLDVRMEFYPPDSRGQALIDVVCAGGAHHSAKTTSTAQIPSEAGQSLTSNGSDQTKLIEDRHYVNSSGHLVHSPAHTTTGLAPSGASAHCADGTYSFSEHRQGTCSHHGGVTAWLN